MSEAYFFFVASPPRKCLSDLFDASNSEISEYRIGLIRRKVLDTSLCTVLLLIPKLFAVLLTVALFSSIYSAIASHRSLPDCIYIIDLPLE